jgi:plastocyanin
MNRTTAHRTMLSLVAGLALVTFGVACGGDSDDGKPSSAGPQAIEMTMKDNVFEPKAITVKAGQSVTINLKNAGPANLHNIHFMGEGVDPKKAATQPIESGKTDKITVKFEKKGTY